VRAIAAFARHVNLAFIDSQSESVSAEGPVDIFTGRKNKLIEDQPRRSTDIDVEDAVAERNDGN
jgi:hypothetical protein